MAEGGTKAKDIFLAALEREPGAREAYLEEACGDDTDLRSRVDALLGAHDDSEVLDGWLGKGMDGDPLSGAAPGDGSPIGSIGDYDLIEKIASGAMGTVYRARQKSLDRIVALKVLRVGRFATDEEVRRFRAEAEAVARLDHANIVPVYEVGEAEQRNFFSMKLIDGPGLDAEIESFHDDPRRVASLVAAVAHGLHHAHQHGLLHRDVKPSNILLDSEGTPHIADFGVAKRVGDDAFETNPGVIAGTPAYMAPEQLMSGGEITVRTDVYSLGCVLFELLTGQPPFTGRTIAEIFHDVREKEAPSIRGRNAVVPRDMAIICRKCLSKDPRKRYGSTLELAEDLERWLEHLPIQARPTSAFERAGLYWRRRPLQASLWATVALLVVTFAIGATTTSFVLREYLNRAIEAEATANDRLRTALVAQARANLRSDRPGRRKESLGLLEQAALIESGPDLRDEAIKAMTLTDLSGRHLWSFDDDENVVGWDFEREILMLAHADGSCSIKTFTEEPLSELPARAGRAWKAIFSADGKRAFVKYHGDGLSDPTVVVWDLDAREVLLEKELWMANQAIAQHPDRRHVLVGSTTSDAFLVDLEQVSVERWFQAAGKCEDVSISPDGEQIAVAVLSEDLVEIRGFHDGELRDTLEFEAGPMSVDWSPGGERLVVGLDDSSALIVQAATGEILDELRGHQAEVVLAFFPRADLAVTSSWDESTRVWDLRTGETLIIAEDAVRGRSPEGRFLVHTNRGRAGVWSVDHGDLLHTFHGHWLKGPRWVAVSPSGEWMVSGGDDDTLFWSLDEQRQIGWLETGPVGGLAFSRDADVLYASTEHGLLRWDFERFDGDPLAVEPEVVLPEGSFRFGFDATETIFVVAVKGEVHIRDLNDPTRNKVLGPAKGTNRLFMSPDGRYAAAGSWRGRGVRIWNVETGELEIELEPEYAETTVAFSPTGERLITGTPDYYRCYETGTWELQYELERSLQPTNLPGTIEFDQTGQVVALAPSTRVMWLLDAPTGELLMSLDAAVSFPFTRMGFLPGRRGIATGTSGLRILLWDLEGMVDELRRRGLDYGLDAWDEVTRTRGVTR